MIDTAHPGRSFGHHLDPSFTLNGPIFVTFNPDENAAKAYVANLERTTVSVIDTATQTVSNVIGSGTTRRDRGEPSRDTRMRMSPTMAVIRYRSSILLSTPWSRPSVGTNPYGLTLSPDGGTFYVATSTDNAVWVVVEGRPMAG